MLSSIKVTQSFQPSKQKLNFSTKKKKKNYLPGQSQSSATSFSAVDREGPPLRPYNNTSSKNSSVREEDDVLNSTHGSVDIDTLLDDLDL